MAYPYRSSILDPVRHHPARDILAAYRRLGNYPFSVRRNRLESEDWTRITLLRRPPSMGRRLRYACPPSSAAKNTSPAGPKRGKLSGRSDASRRGEEV